MGVRFAPSPTGRFHIGNLRTAWASHWWARELKLPWVVRFEDIDTPRVVPGAQEQQLADMATLGLIPDQIYKQSECRLRHWELFERAKLESVIYPCFCSRKEVQEALQAAASAPHQAPAIYDGRCRVGTPMRERDQIAWRFKNRDPSGSQDFIVARTDLYASFPSFVPAYHWACAIDDYDGGYSLLVRAWDLRDATEQQRAISVWMGPNPLAAVFHTSVVVNNGGERLEKRTRGITLPELSISTQQLLASFQQSFTPGVYEISKVWGEDNKILKLAKLL